MGKQYWCGQRPLAAVFGLSYPIFHKSQILFFSNYLEAKMFSFSLIGYKFAHVSLKKMVFFPLNAFGLFFQKYTPMDRK